MKINLGKLARLALRLVVNAPAIIAAVKPVIDEVKRAKKRDGHPDDTARQEAEQPVSPATP